MKKGLLYFLFITAITFYSCSATKNSGSTDNGRIDVNFIQVNDVYEIAPLEGGRSGGMARVAFIKKKYLTQNPNTFLLMAGDFLSPSIYNSLQFEGKRIRGRQMVESMNAAGMDLVVFGNHEFDISESELKSRINESDFQWISSNAFNKEGNTIRPFVKTKGDLVEQIPETFIQKVTDADGTTVRIGFIGITIPFNKAAYVTYTDPLATAEKLYNRIKDSCDVVIALTHQLVQDDVLLARRLPNLAMIIGGHEHDQRFQKEGNVIIAKAHANAKSAYILRLRINKNKKQFHVRHQLEMIDEKVGIDAATDSVVKKWTAIAEKNYSSLGFDAKKIIMSSGEPLDGREAVIRSQPTNLTRLIVSGMEYAAPQAEIAILNAGSIRVDDMLQMPVSQYDILRTLPFGGSVIEADMKGSLLLRIMETGRTNKGIGGFLHYSTSVRYDSTGNKWYYKESLIDPVRNYKIVMTDFLLTGGESNLGFLKKDNPEIVKIYPIATNINDPRSDIRLAVIKYAELQIEGRK